MQALTAIGEVGIEYKGRSYLLRPSLFSMTRIGTPKEIVETFGIIMGGEPIAHPVYTPDAVKRWRAMRFETCLHVIRSCCDEDVTPLVGGLVPSRTGAGLRYQPGGMAIDAVLAIARCLMRHGVVGNAQRDTTKPEEVEDFNTEFNAADFVANAMAHLGMTAADAWQMTMTTFHGAMRAKFPAPPGGKPPKPHTPKQYDATMARLEKINALRRASKK